jgi:hypothetical protein
MDWYESLMGKVKATAHRVLPVPTREQLAAMLAEPGGEEKAYGLFKQREELIRLEAADPYRFGMVLECWKDADGLLYGETSNFKAEPRPGNQTSGKLQSSSCKDEGGVAGVSAAPRDVARSGETWKPDGGCMVLAIFGGNRASKTEYCCRKGVEVLVEKANANALFLHESEQTSVEIQQKTVFKYLPMEWRQARKGQVTNISYSRKNGFSDNKFVFPNGSVGVFGSYKQDVGDYEGLEYDVIVADEDLPLAWLETLKIRLATRNGKFLWGFTPIRGITPAVKTLVDGAVTVRSRPVDPDLLDPEKVHVDDCPAGHMPYVQRSAQPKTSIIYFHSDLNPFGGYETLKEILQGYDEENRKRRGYGWARNSIQTLFPQFSAVHIIEESQVPRELTRYHIMDPASARNMFQIWWGVDKRGYSYIYREWPSESEFGPWAEPSEDSKRWDGTAGPAQPTLGWGVVDYKRMILKAEGNKWSDGATRTGQLGWELCGEQIEARYIDPRSGKAAAITEEEGGSSLIDRFLDDQVNARTGVVEGPSMDFLQAKGLHMDEGIQAINDLLRYDKRQAVTAFVNEPRLYVSSSCTNVIWALKNYTGHDGEKAACKDPVDCLRYGATEKLEYLEPGRVMSVGGGSY